MSASLRPQFKLRVCIPSPLGRGAVLACLAERPSLPFPLFQDALLSLGSVIDIAGLQQAVKEALSALLPKVVRALPHTFLPLKPLLHSS